MTNEKLPNEDAHNDWDRRHQATLGSRRGLDAADAMPLLVQLVSPLQPGRALDLACGLGRNSLWLAEHGWQVTAVDRSETAITAVREAASRQGVQITALIADLESLQFVIKPGAWDLIVICNYLQRNLYEPAKRGLAPGGLLIASALLLDPAKGSEPQRFRVAPGELSSYFRDCDILHYDEDPIPSAPSQTHRAAEIAVRRRI